MSYDNDGNVIISASCDSCYSKNESDYNLL